jgi:hypothetical protein
VGIPRARVGRSGNSTFETCIYLASQTRRKYRQVTGSPQLFLNGTWILEGLVVLMANKVVPDLNSWRAKRCHSATLVEVGAITTQPYFLLAESRARKAAWVGWSGGAESGERHTCAKGGGGQWQQNEPALPPLLTARG